MAGTGCEEHRFAARRGSSGRQKGNIFYAGKAKGGGIVLNLRDKSGTIEVKVAVCGRAAQGDR